ncbi:unnamed protein product [Leuciscus chuanchicus]
MIHFGTFGGGSEEVEEMGREVKRGNDKKLPVLVAPLSLPGSSTAVTTEKGLGYQRNRECATRVSMQQRERPAASASPVIPLIRVPVSTASARSLLPGAQSLMRISCCGPGYVPAAHDHKVSLTDHTKAEGTDRFHHLHHTPITCSSEYLLESDRLDHQTALRLGVTKRVSNWIVCVCVLLMLKASLAGCRLDAFVEEDTEELL